MKSDSSLRRLLPFAAYFNICFFWGTAGVANKLSSSMIHPFFAGSLRFLIASVWWRCGWAFGMSPLLSAYVTERLWQWEVSLCIF